MIQIQRDISKDVPNARMPVRPTAIHAALDKRLAGLQDAKRFISTRIAIHLRRALDLATTQESTDRNQCLLIMGPSGAGKTFLVEQAAAIAKVPFVSASAAALTEEGYVGAGLTSVLNSLRQKCANRKLARYGICFLDEWDKRVHGHHEKPGFSHGVQAEILRMMEGTEVEIETRGPNRSSIKFDTKGLMFVFAGAFENLEPSPDTASRRRVTGFSPCPGPEPASPDGHALRSALAAYGMLPEFINRLTGIITLPTPTMDDMLALLGFGNGPLEACNRRLRGLGAELVLTPAAAQALARHACDTRAYCRGIHLLLQSAMDYLIYEGIQGQVQLDAGDVRDIVTGHPLGLTPARDLAAAPAAPRANSGAKAA